MSISNYASKQAIKVKELTCQNARLKTSLTTANKQLQMLNNKTVIVPDMKDSTDIVFIVMGFFSMWHTALENLDGNIALIYASYDEPVSYNSSINYQTIHIPGTTWTQGRNFLAEEAIRLERKRCKEFTHWIFSDDDIVPFCDMNVAGYKEEFQRVYGDDESVSCWQHVIDYIGSSKVPEKASLMVGQSGPRGFFAVSTADAMFNVFKRKYVPYLLPYATLPEGTSEWLSQAALFCIIRNCLKYSAAIIPYIGFANGLHREYARGLDRKQYRTVIKNNYINEGIRLEKCLKYHAIGDQYKQATSLLLYDEADMLNDLMPFNDLSPWSGLKDRFERWEKSIDLIDEVARQ